MGWLTGSPARLKDPRILAGSDGRDSEGMTTD